MRITNCTKVTDWKILECKLESKASKILKNTGKERRITSVKLNYIIWAYCCRKQILKSYGLQEPTVKQTQSYVNEHSTIHLYLLTS